jgi:hypothetical protein
MFRRDDIGDTGSCGSDLPLPERPSEANFLGHSIYEFRDRQRYGCRVDFSGPAGYVSKTCVEGPKWSRAGAGSKPFSEIRIYENTKSNGHF